MTKATTDHSNNHNCGDAATNQVNDSNALLKITGGLMVGLPDSEVILGTIDSVTRHNLKHEILNADEITSRFPLLHLLPSEIGDKIRSVLYFDGEFLLRSCKQAHPQLLTGQSILRTILFTQIIEQEEGSLFLM